MARLELTQVPGIGAVTAQRLREIGVDSVAALATRPVDDLAALPGFHASRAATAQAAARQLLGAVAEDTTPVAKAVGPAAKVKAAKVKPPKSDERKKAKKKKKGKKAAKGEKASRDGSKKAKKKAKKTEKKGAAKKTSSKKDTKKKKKKTKKK